MWYPGSQVKKSSEKSQVKKWKRGSDQLCQVINFVKHVSWKEDQELWFRFSNLETFGEPEKTSFNGAVGAKSQEQDTMEKKNERKWIWFFSRSFAIIVRNSEGWDGELSK